MELRNDLVLSEVNWVLNMRREVMLFGESEKDQRIMLRVQQQTWHVKVKIIYINSTSKTYHSKEVVVEGSAQFVLDRNFKTAVTLRCELLGKIIFHLAINLKSNLMVYRGLSHRWRNLQYIIASHKKYLTFDTFLIFDRCKKDFLAAIVNIEKYLMDNYSN